MLVIELPQFKDWPGACRPSMDGPCCKKCRHPGERHAEWREDQTGTRDFPCPYKLEEISISKGNLMPKPIKIRPRASKSAKNAASLLSAMATRERVSDEEKGVREAKCAICGYLGNDNAGTWCGVPSGCGCNVKSVSFLGMTIEGTSIAAYSEKEGRLCLHPNRDKGDGWPM